MLKMTGISHCYGEHKVLKKMTLTVSPGQRIAIVGPTGAGKTTVIKGLISIFDTIGLDVALCAPTGRAAKRLSEATSMEAKTIHRLLEMGYDPDGRAVFNRNDFDLLDEQIIIVDEASMIDITLMQALAGNPAYPRNDGLAP